jgi:hypothetical protein
VIREVKRIHLVRPTECQIDAQVFGGIFELCLFLDMGFSGSKFRSRKLPLMLSF